MPLDNARLPINGQNALFRSTDWQNGKVAFVGKLGYLLIFVEDHSVDEHVVAFANVMHLDSFPTAEGNIGNETAMKR